MPISFQGSGWSRAGSPSGGEKHWGVRSHVSRLTKESFVLFWLEISLRRKGKVIIDLQNWPVKWITCTNKG